eukprot:CAMPEP_0171131698 /NCGR_PEP_ID=MMETSP0766_2-20121228/123233_1 /TAXON_ID=439317 /ORGANISM="Gambierdiscus australes, Strain CAWD 149" /LENGTH=85 /DNA_ID=CAMNT_0011595011 /DNA_START=305 /DNA_END=562 /DNA_ORIENTATION=+
MTSCGTGSRSIWRSKANATSQCLTFSQALIAALHVVVVSVPLSNSRWWRRSRAHAQRAPLSPAVTAALQEMVSGGSCPHSISFNR